MKTQKVGTVVVAWALALATGGCGQKLDKLAKGEGALAAEAKAVIAALAESGIKPKEVQVWERRYRTSKCDSGKPCAGIVVRGEGAKAHIAGLFVRGAGEISLKSLSKISGLLSLRLGKNRITQASGLAGLGNLITVDLSQNQIQKVEGLTGLPKLTRLDLRNNKIVEISGLKDLPRLRSFHISKNPLKAVRNLSNLGITELNFGKAPHLRTVSNLSRLPGLRRIVATKGVLKTLELSDLPALEAIDVRNNLLTGLSLRNLPKLKLVGAIGNRLENSGLILEKLPGLTHLGLDRNRLTMVPRITGRTKLAQLSLKRNRLTSLRGLELLSTKPKEVFVDRNQLTSLEVGAGTKPFSMVRVVTLSADYNKLTSLKGIENFRFIRYLYLNRNQITSLKGIENLRFLRKLQVAYNRLTALKPLRVAGLKELVARGNKIASAPELFGPENNRRPRIGYYDLRGNGFPLTMALLLYYGRPMPYRGMYRVPVVWGGRTRTTYRRRYRSGRVGSRYSRSRSRRWGK